MKKLYVADKETGTFIDLIENILDGKKLIDEYDKEDRENNEYTEGFYDIVDEEHNHIEW